MWPTGRMAPLPPPLLAEANASLGQFTLEMARACGASRHTLNTMRANGELALVQPRVLRFTVVPATADSRVLAAVLAGGDEAVASYTSAARLHGLERVESAEHPEITVLDSSAPKLWDVSVHRVGALVPADRTRVRGIPCTSGARTVLDCARAASWEDAVALVDDAVSRRITSRDAVHERACALANGRRNAGVLREVTHPRAEGEFWSWLERELGKVIRRGGLPRPAFNVAVHDRRGRIGYADALYRREGVVIEAEGLRFHTLPDVRRSDAERFNRYVNAGLRPLRFTWYDIVRRPEHVVATLRDALAAARVTRPRPQTGGL